MGAPLIIGAFGLGSVGQGFLRLLDASSGHKARVKHICVKRRGRIRDAGNARLTYDALDILTDDDVHAIVEMTNDPELAIDVIRRALNSGRQAVTASKKVVAEHLAELIRLQRATGRSLLYEASCAASIPVLHTLETHFSGEEVLAIDGILNGTTNHILTRMEKGVPLRDALRTAQAEGFAELDPSSDLSGEDARYKLTILLAHAFGTVVGPQAIPCHGIEGLSAADLGFGRERGWVVRLVATAYRKGPGVSAFVLPRFVPADDAFAFVRDEYNAVRIVGAHSGTHLLQGKGAGRLPTGLAVLGDVQRLTRGGGYAYGKVTGSAPVLANDGEHIAVYARIPSHQERPARFSTVWTTGTDGDAVRVTGTIALNELVRLLGEGRDGLQVVALPHLSGRNTGCP